jgi:hypothetical protein
MLMCCVCVFLICRESLDMILGDKPLIFEVVISQWYTKLISKCTLIDIMST